MPGLAARLVMDSHESRLSRFHLGVSSKVINIRTTIEDHSAVAD